MSIQVNPDAPFHATRDGIVVALSLEELDAAYQADHVQDDTLIWQEGFTEWMRLDMLLHTLEQQEGPIEPIQEVADDIFHVLVAPEEVKQMSLDLLADAYRLEVIDDDTLVWQEGFTEWLPISALLGPEDAHVSIAPSMPPAYNGGYAPSVSMPPAQEAPAFHFGSIGPIDDSLIPAATDLSSLVPTPPPKTSPWYGRSLVALGALCAFFVSYRAGAMESGTEGPEAGSLLASVESKVGSPGVDTLQGLDRWLAQLEKTHGLDALSETSPLPEPGSLSKKVPESQEAAPSAASADETGDAEKAPQGEEKKPEAASEKKDNVAANAFSSSLSGKPQKAAAAPARRPVVRSSKPSSGTTWKGSQKGSAYDPMNGAL